MNSATSVFRDQYMDDGAPEMTSAPIPMQGNKAVLAITGINISGGTPVFEFQMQGSYDGAAWIAVGAAKTMTAFGYDSVAQGSVDTAFLRVRVKKSSGTTPKILFSASIAMSEQ